MAAVVEPLTMFIVVRKDLAKVWNSLDFFFLSIAIYLKKKKKKKLYLYRSFNGQQAGKKNQQNLTKKSFYLYKAIKVS